MVTKLYNCNCLYSWPCINMESCATFLSAAFLDGCIESYAVEWERKCMMQLHDRMVRKKFTQMSALNVHRQLCFVQRRGVSFDWFPSIHRSMRVATSNNLQPRDNKLGTKKWNLGRETQTSVKFSGNIIQVSLAIRAKRALPSARIPRLCTQDYYRFSHACTKCKPSRDLREFVK